jgi:hypothetical protein
MSPKAYIRPRNQFMHVHSTAWPQSLAGPVTMERCVVLLLVVLASIAHPSGASLRCTTLRSTSIALTFDPVPGSDWHQVRGVCWVKDNCMAGTLLKSVKCMQHMSWFVGLPHGPLVRLVEYAAHPPCMRQFGSGHCKEFVLRVTSGR